MREFRYEDDEDYLDIEAEAWHEFKANGGFDLIHENGRNDYIRKAVAAIYLSDIESNGFHFYAGYGVDDRLVDCFNVPATVFEHLFPNDKKAEWNTAEACHWFEIEGETKEAVVERISKTLTEAGFEVEIEE